MRFTNGRVLGEETGARVGWMVEFGSGDERITVHLRRRPGLSSESQEELVARARALLASVSAAHREDERPGGHSGQPLPGDGDGGTIDRDPGREEGFGETDAAGVAFRRGTHDDHLRAPETVADAGIRRERPAARQGDDP